MDEFWQVVVLGIVQGAAEFLPISSSGHLVLVKHALSWWTGREVLSSGKDLEVLLHLGTLAAIVVVYAHDLRRELFNQRQWGLVLLASLPAAAVGLTFEDWIDRTFNSPVTAGYGLLVTACLLSAAQRQQEGQRDLAQLGWWQAFVIGCFQALALLPGISRSGSTIAGGLLTGLERVSATRFSFLMALPVTAGAIGLSLKHVGAHGLSVSAASAATGVMVSFFVGWISLRVLIRLMTQRRLYWFAGYCAVLGLITLVVCGLTGATSREASPPPVAYVAR